MMSSLKGVERFQQACWSSSTQLKLLMLQTLKITDRPRQSLKIDSPLAWFLYWLLVQQFLDGHPATPFLIHLLFLISVRPITTILRDRDSIERTPLWPHPQSQGRIPPMQQHYFFPVPSLSVQFSVSVTS